MTQRTACQRWDGTVEAMVDPIEVEEFDDRIPNVRISHAIREALLLDGINLRDVFRRRATVMTVSTQDVLWRILRGL